METGGGDCGGVGNIVGYIIRAGAGGRGSAVNSNGVLHGQPVIVLY